MDPFVCAIAIVKQAMAKSVAHQEKVDANTKTTEMEPTTEQKTEFLKAIKEILAETNANANANHEEMMAKIQTETEAI
jgi:tRNA C32,U32 (ribose-2'-O)-methylase TrmJ